MAALPPSKQLDLLAYGTDEIVPLEELEQKLARSVKENRPLRVKLGLDPSAPDIHIGHAVVLRKLRQFQDLGHLAVLIVGDFTGTIGDPSGRTEKRKRLTDEEVRENAETYVAQLTKILDKDRIEVVYNGDWLRRMDMGDTLRLTSTYTVARMLERDDFNLRFKDEKPISILEFMYPLLQGYDSVAVRSDVELGGTDQKFNLLVGRDIQRDYGQEPQVIMTMPLLEGTDGVAKMSKSLGNYIGITDAPEDMFGKVMSIPDALIVRYYRLATRLTKQEADEIEAGLENGTVHPNETKRRLAGLVVSEYYDDTAARQAEEAFNVKHKQGYASQEAQKEIAEPVTISAGVISLVDLIMEAGFAASRSDARRLIEQNAVSINGNKISDKDAHIELKDGDLLQVGKRRFGRIDLTS